jgi:hypothetical protein
LRVLGTFKLTLAHFVVVLSSQPLAVAHIKTTLVVISGLLSFKLNVLSHCLLKSCLELSEIILLDDTNADATTTPDVESFSTLPNNETLQINNASPDGEVLDTTNEEISRVLDKVLQKLIRESQE